MRINLTDNNYGISDLQTTYSRQAVAPLFPLADRPIEDLCRENGNLLIFPNDIEESKDRIGKMSIIGLSSTSDPDRVRLETGNVMGFFGTGGIQVKIRSRFDDGRSDFLLHYMLQKVYSFNLFDLEHENDKDDVFDFLMFMFPFYLKSALRQGIYRQYRRFQHNDPDVKGPIDIARHIKTNNPFAGNVAYTTREYSADNWMTELIRHTVEFMKTRKYGASVLKMDKETMESIDTIVSCTPSYSPDDRRKVIDHNLRTAAHPYYTEYMPLQSLCLQILRMNEIRFGETEDEICGILFDGAWLWEEYVNTILCKHGFIHPENRTGKGKQYLFADRDENGKVHRSGARYPDFFKDGWVVDAKYKKLGSLEKVSKIDRDDINQVRTYMAMLNATTGGFVAPLENVQRSVPRSHFKGQPGTMSIFGITISKETEDYAAFCSEMAINEQAFVCSLGL